MNTGMFFIIWGLAVVVGATHPVFEASETILTCLRSHRDVRIHLSHCYQKALTRYPLPANKNNVKAIAKTYCIVTNPETCLLKNVGILTRCFVEEKYGELQSVLDMISGGYLYACEQDGAAKVKEFIESDGPACLENLYRNKMTQLQECVNRSVQTGRQELSQVDYDDVRKEEVVTCKFVDKQKDCLVSLMNCTNEKPAQIIESLASVMLQKLSCWGYYVAESSGSENYFGNWWSSYVATFCFCVCVIVLVVADACNFSLKFRPVLGC